MVKKRVHELAKELDIESKTLINKAIESGINVKSHMSTLDISEVEKLTKEIKPKSTANTQQSENHNSPGKKLDPKTGGDRKKEQPTNNKKHESTGKNENPGLVDKVPSRPPDRRFSDKPSSSKSGGYKHPNKRNQPQTNAAKSEQSTGSTSNVEVKTKRYNTQDKTNTDKANGNKPAGNKHADNRNQQSRSKGKPVDKAKAAEKAKPDRTKAQEKEHAHEKAKNAEKQAYRESQKQKQKNDKLKKYNEGKMPSIPNKKRKTVDNNKNNIQVKGKTISIPSSITIKDISTKMGVRSSEIIKKLMSMGVMANINQEIDSETAVIVGEEFNVEVKVKQEKDNESLLLQEIEDNPSELQSRPCVVTVIGHVDHGKTSLLDAVRETKVTASESGGITQHIGAYQVERNGKKITFLDTPGHEAFTAMRARGTQVTDIAILVIGADDGVMPQTVEAINHAKAAGVSIIVAINKIDKANADQDKVKRELTEYELIPEEWGGDTICVPVSATMHEGLDDLLEMILLVSEMQELKANPNCYSRGIVIESKLDKGRGAVATVLIKKGTLKVGDALVAGTSHGKVRAMMDYRRERVDSAGPSFPVQVLGFSEVPDAGDKFFALEDEKKARDICEKRKDRKREEELKVPAPKVSLDDVFNQIKEGQVKELSLIIKADVQGSVEALKQSLEKLSTDEVKVNIIHIGVGAITETDIMLASASNAIVIGFNVRPDANARKAAELEKIDVRTYRVIYDVIENIKSAMTGLLDPEYKEVILGHAQVRKTFKVSKLGTIAGCYVTDGKLVRDSGARLIRDGVVVYEGKMDSLKRYKDDTKEVVENYECGLTLEKFNDINEDDIIEAFTTEAVKRELT